MSTLRKVRKMERVYFCIDCKYETGIEQVARMHRDARGHRMARRLRKRYDMHGQPVATTSSAEVWR